MNKNQKNFKDLRELIKEENKHHTNPFKLKLSKIGKYEFFKEVTLTTNGKYLSPNLIYSILKLNYETGLLISENDKIKINIYIDS